MDLNHFGTALTPVLGTNDLEVDSNISLCAVQYYVVKGPETPNSRHTIMNLKTLGEGGGHYGTATVPAGLEPPKKVIAMNDEQVERNPKKTITAHVPTKPTSHGCLSHRGHRQVLQGLTWGG